MKLNGLGFNGQSYGANLPAVQETSSYGGLATLCRGREQTRTDALF